MNLITRLRRGPERAQERLLVRLWTMNTLEADDNLQPAKLTLAAKTELRSSIRYLTGPEIEQTVQSTLDETAYHHQLVHNLRKHIQHGRNGS